MFAAFLPGSYSSSQYLCSLCLCVNIITVMDDDQCVIPLVAASTIISASGAASRTGGISTSEDEARTYQSGYAVPPAD